MLELQVALKQPMDPEEQKEADLQKQKYPRINRELDKTLIEGIDLYAELVQKNVEVMKIIQEDGSQWKVLQKQLLQNQEDVRRLFRELDSKSQSLKLTAAEVISIKRKIRIVKRENLALREELERAAEFEPQVFANRPDLMVMDDEEVRNKILSIAKVGFSRPGIPRRTRAQQEPDEDPQNGPERHR